LVHNFVGLDESTTLSTGKTVYLGLPEKSVRESELTPDLKNWIENSENDIFYVCLGTVASQTCELLQNMAEGIALVSKQRNVLWGLRKSLLESCSTDVLVSVRDNPNVKILEWVPQTLILRHPKVKAFWTHGGFNSLSEAVQAGIPMMCMPIFADQYDNCAVVQRKNLGITIQASTLTADTVQITLEELLSSSAIAQASKELERVASVMSKHGVPHACDLMELVADIGDQYFLSPGNAYTWYVRENYDLLLVAAIVFYCGAKFTYILSKVVGRQLLWYFSSSDTKTEIALSKKMD
jgi:hypothetical protein